MWKVQTLWLCSASDKCTEAECSLKFLEEKKIDAEYNSDSTQQFKNKRKYSKGKGEFSAFP